MVRSPRELESGARDLPLRGARRVRRRVALPREVARGEPPRRGPGRRRPVRQRRPPRRARLLGPAAPPEDPRGGPDARARVAAARADLCQRALRAAVVAAGYENLGTLEFLVDAAGNFYFIEINCRIQVEHPVTEMLTGHRPRRDCRSASRPASRSGYTQARRALRGHAIEFRINAEDPSDDFRPQRRRWSRRTSRPAARACAWTRTSTRATRCRRTTTRCSASSSSGGPTARRRSRAAATALDELRRRRPRHQPPDPPRAPRQPAFLEGRDHDQPARPRRQRGVPGRRRAPMTDPIATESL